MKSDSKIIINAVIIVMAVLLIVIAFILYVSFTKKNDENDNKSTNNVANLNETTNVIANEVEKVEYSDEIEVVPTMEDELIGDTVWCPTFQLVWNDMKNEVVKQDVEFIEGDEPDYLDNLNAESFTEDNLSDEYYYKKWGIKSNDLKNEILDGVKEKFNETSDVIDENDDWDEWKKYATSDEKRYIFYAMLKKVFNFENPFDELEDGHFNNENGTWYNNVKYFGIDDESNKKLKKQVTILYYSDFDNFAISIKTKENDEVILAKGIEGKTFAEMYENIQKSSDEYTGETVMGSDDVLKIPNLKFNVFKEYEDLKNKLFYNADGEECFITNAIQTVKFEMDNEGGKIKSEAIIEMPATSALEEEVKFKNLTLDSDFVMFVKEADKDLPYFALNVSDISKFQDEVSIEE